MKCQGDFIFKSLTKVEAGEFNNNGRLIQYPSSYKLTLDEWNEGNLNSIKLKVPENNATLISKIRNLKPYDKILLDCEIAFYNNSVKVIPVDIKFNSVNK